MKLWYLNFILILLVNLILLKYLFRFFLLIISIIFVLGNMKCILVFCLVVVFIVIVYVNSCMDVCDVIFIGCV